MYGPINLVSSSLFIYCHVCQLYVLCERWYSLINIIVLWIILFNQGPGSESAISLGCAIFRYIIKQQTDCCYSSENNARYFWIFFLFVFCFSLCGFFCAGLSDAHDSHHSNTHTHIVSMAIRFFFRFLMRHCIWRKVFVTMHFQPQSMVFHLIDWAHATTKTGLHIVCPHGPRLTVMTQCVQ